MHLLVSGVTTTIAVCAFLRQIGSENKDTQGMFRSSSERFGGSASLTPQTLPT